jgi:hypothetical protein
MMLNSRRIWGAALAGATLALVLIGPSCDAIS